jgi:hypothetical protein
VRQVAEMQGAMSKLGAGGGCAEARAGRPRAGGEQQVLSIGGAARNTHLLAGSD